MILKYCEKILFILKSLGSIIWLTRITEYPSKLINLHESNWTQHEIKAVMQISNETSKFPGDFNNFIVFNTSVLQRKVLIKWNPPESAKYIKYIRNSRRPKKRQRHGLFSPAIWTENKTFYVVGHPSQIEKIAGTLSTR